ncbi:kinase-like domain-containing protein [Boletus edulis BED1]|uniref:Kinase-like domain-containing protein n=1 Tax=Boletus edulis BED1 TaxID=1328754 RepID=A0AAD4BRA0_BOLED|nr:kinase-like domain-containing protein [Boletus edulis BED1]
MTDILTLIGVTNASSLGRLLPAFELVQQMVDVYGHIKLGQKRCKSVIQRAALIIREVHSNPKLRSDQINIAKLQKKFGEIQTILQKLVDMSFLKALLHFENINKEIERANQHLTDCLQLFQIHPSSHVQSQRSAEISDRDALRVLLKILTGNYEEIRRRFGLYNDEQIDLAMAVMGREVRNARVAFKEDMPMEVQIMQKSLECIKATTGRNVPKQNAWLITEYDLDYCGTIGGGGFSTVSKARFRGTMVAVKTLKDVGNMREALEREVEIWSKLRYDHIVPFYGASTLTSPPYIVSRYMQNGNLVQFLATTPNADCRKLILEVSLGMYYLQEESVVHGDLKGVNVLVDDSGKACITDFGLSNICSSGTAGTNTSKISGTLRYLAPEALRGQPLSFETDVYAFGMLIYEVFAGEVPFINEPDHLVFEGCLKLHRPKSSTVYARGLNDALWRLLSDCISREPSARPRFKTIQEQLCSMKNPEPLAQSVHPDPTLWTENKQVTDWGLDSKLTAFTSPTLVNSTTPLLPKGKSVPREQPDISSRMSISRDIKTFQPLMPACIQLTHKYFGVKFGVTSREPGATIEDANTSMWQSIRANKGTLLCEDGKNKFWYSSSAGHRNSNSWELGGNDVILRTTLIDPGVCHFEDEEVAQKWFGLQLSYARNGFVEGWGTAKGDWFYTERSWRRLGLGKIQQAGVVEGDPDAMPDDHSWGDVNLPKRRTIDNNVGTENCIVCITNPGKQRGRFFCKLEGSRIVLETYRLQGDEWPINVREETYPSEEYAEAAFCFLKKALGKAPEKRSFFRSF